MKYTIGCRVLDVDGHVKDGIYIFNQYGLPYIGNEIPKTGKHSIYVVEGAEDAQLYIRYLSRLYRQEFRKRAKQLNASVKEFRLYPIKMTDERVKDLVLEKDSQYRVCSRTDEYQFLGQKHNIGVYYIKE